MLKPLRLGLLLTSVFLLSGCMDWFEGDGKVPLKGERVSILQLQKALTADADAAAQQVALPAAQNNHEWAQTGGIASHALSHVALGNNLHLAWKESIGAGGDKRTPLTATPIVAENTVFTLDTEGNVTAFNLKDGRQKWRQSVLPKEEGKQGSGALGGGLAYAGGHLFVTNGYKQLITLNAQDGAKLWNAVTPAPVRSAPSVMGDRVYCITLDNRLMVFSTVDGSLLWNFTGVSETTNLVGAASPALDESLVVLPLSSGELFGLRPENGQSAWQDNLSAIRKLGSLASIADIRGLPVIDRGVVFAVSYSGRMVALDAVTGARLWQREIGSAETPWSAGDALFVITQNQELVSLMRTDGSIRWVTALPRWSDKDKEDPVVWTGPVLAGGRLIAASSNGKMAEIDPANGKTLRMTDLSGDVLLPPVVADNTLLLLTRKGELTAWR